MSVALSIAVAMLAALALPFIDGECHPDGSDGGCNGGDRCGPSWC